MLLLLQPQEEACRKSRPTVPNGQLQFSYICSLADLWHFRDSSTISLAKNCLITFLAHIHRFRRFATLFAALSGFATLFISVFAYFIPSWPHFLQICYYLDPTSCRFTSFLISPFADLLPCWFHFYRFPTFLTPLFADLLPTWFHCL